MPSEVITVRIGSDTKPIIDGYRSKKQSISDKVRLALQLLNALENDDHEQVMELMPASMLVSLASELQKFMVINTVAMPVAQNKINREATIEEDISDYIEVGSTDEQSNEVGDNIDTSFADLF